MSSRTVQLLTGLAVVLVLQLSLTACNTMRGAGQDISAAGEAIEKKADQKQSY